MGGWRKDVRLFLLIYLFLGGRDRQEEGQQSTAMECMGGAECSSINSLGITAHGPHEA